ncbi:MAG: hypothetical protein AB1420_04315 [Bacillota bacterium]
MFNAVNIVPGEDPDDFKQWGGHGPGYEIDFVLADFIFGSEDALVYERVIVDVIFVHDSKHYSLSDFGTTGEKGVRMHDDYMKNYFVSQYGAIKDIDFTPIFENLKTLLTVQNS